MKNRNNKKPFKKGSVGNSSENPELQSPVFSFEKMQDGNGFSVSCCDQIDQAALSKKLFTLSQMTWQQIRQADRHGLGTEIIDRDSLTVQLPNSVTEDVNIMAFRFSGKKPMLGYRDRRIFHVLLLDHNFTAYDHG